MLGLVELPKPPLLAARGGCWFEDGPVKLHLGVEDDFRPARKAHPALLVDGLRAFVDERDLDVRWSDEIPGTCAATSTTRSATASSSSEDARRPHGHRWSGRCRTT